MVGMSDADQTTSENEENSENKASSEEMPLSESSSFATQKVVKSPKSRSDGGVVKFKDIYSLKYEKRLPHLDNGPIQAFEAAGKTNKSMFVLVCEIHLTPRFRDSVIFSKNTEGALLKLVSSGKVYWPPEDKYKYIFIYEGNPGRPILEAPQNAALGMKADHVMKGFLKPIIGGLKALRDLDLYHGHVRLDNIYGINDEGGFDKVVLGDCLSLPPGYSQDATYQPVHKALAQPSGRGLGNISDDLYALGVCAAMLLRSADPTKNLSDREILELKLSQGSYMTLTNKDRFSGGILELLRGLLQDEPSQRWTMDEVLSWMEGQRLVPKQGIKRNRASRPIAMGDQRHYYAETLSMNIHDHQAEAVQLIESEAIDQWLGRSVEDTKKVENMEVAVRTAREYGRTTNYWDRLTCRVGVVLDPKQPIRYRGYSFFPDGVGHAMAEAFKERKDMNPFAHIINQQVVPFWRDLQTDTYLDVSAIALSFESCRSSLKQNQTGYGLERCVYMLCPESPCLSDTYDRFIIRDASDFLSALDELAEKRQMPKDVFDPHITAFLLVRNNRVIEPNLRELNSPEEYLRIFGVVKVLAAMQKHVGKYNNKALTRWAAEYAEPFFDRYHDKDMRDKKLEDLKKEKESGDLREIVAVLNDPKSLQKDTVDFKRSVRKYYKLKLESYKLEKELQERETYGMGAGREIAAIVSGFIGSIIVLVMTFIFFSGGDIIPGL